MNRACRNELCADHEPLDLSARGAGEVLRQRQKLRPVLLGDSKLRQVVGYVLEAELLLRRSWDNQRMAALAEPLIGDADDPDVRSEEHTYELQSLMRISYAVFCL